MRSAHCSILFLILLAGVCPSRVTCWCWTDAALVGGATVVGVAATPFVISAGLGALGFSAAGTAAGSAGAALMSTYGGSIAAGSVVSVMQSVGAAGVGVAGQALGGAVAGTTAYVISGGNCNPKTHECEKERR
ncbi:interferon alpha-inducible protein 27-like protein 1 [Pecten maximus]|uniref:interferon alpha-inducible protein 27-like protein 1 n=1 Tax=Pecten maximus TaxID=6579 RepID=UPI00145805EA|nr:interferon alpha-inducible protein 27-like protein 1 [Pecten maximus]XP_033763189.1 interferon alpha-inducible protein 27-like protein 1 [Pecten maximus]XP_033763196.1 interferon alpha-inducible protein 27-like protein 1 [Pecten maximus]